jgi:hypothetical protein
MKKSNNPHLVHHAMNLSNSFIEDLEKVGKFYEKDKSYIKAKAKGGLVLYYIPVIEQLVFN